MEQLTNFVLQTGPFYFPLMFSKLGLGRAAGLMVGIVAVTSLLPIVAIHFVASHAIRTHRQN